MGTIDMAKCEVVGTELDRFQRRWAKPDPWHGRGNREWLISTDPLAPLASWNHYGASTDTLNLSRWLGKDPKAAVGVAVRVYAEGYRKAFLWTGLRGRLTTFLNGEKVAEDENFTTYRVGQFQTPVELQPGENLLLFRLQPHSGEGLLSALLVGTRNDGDTVEGIRWSA